MNSSSPSPFSILPEQVAHVGKPFPARRTPAAGLPREKLHEIERQRNQAGLLIENHDRRGAQAVSDCLQVFEIHLDIVMLFGQEPRGSALREGTP